MHDQQVHKNNGDHLPDQGKYAVSLSNVFGNVTSRKLSSSRRKLKTHKPDFKFIFWGFALVGIPRWLIHSRAFHLSAQLQFQN